MKHLNLYMIRDMALSSGRAVFSVQQLANLVGKQKSIAKVYANRLVKKGLAKQIVRGKISFVNDEFVIACQLIEPSYISCRSALLFHQLMQQVPSTVECASPKRSAKYEGLGITYHKIPPSLFFGYERHRKSGSYIFVADKEKALVDSVYLNCISRGDAREIAAGLDRGKLKEYAAKLDGRGKKKLKRWLA